MAGTADGLVCLGGLPGGDGHVLGSMSGSQAGQADEGGMAGGVKRAGARDGQSVF